MGKKNGPTKPKTKNEYLKAIGSRLRVEREAQGVNLEDMAQAIGVSINTIRWHEAGSRMLRADDLASAARVLKLAPSAMMVPHYEDRETDAIIRLALGRRLQSERAASNVRQVDIVQKSGVTMYEIQNHEAGVRSLRGDEMIRIAEAMGIDPQRLMVIEYGNAEPINP